MFRVAVTGSREWPSALISPVQVILYDFLDHAVATGDTQIVHGDATRGIDAWCFRRCTYLRHRPEVHGAYGQVRLRGQFIPVVHSGDYIRRDVEMIQGRGGNVITGDAPPRTDAPVNACFAFWNSDTKTHGTEHTFRAAMEQGLVVVVYKWAGVEPRPHVMHYVGNRLVEEYEYKPAALKEHAA